MNSQKPIRGAQLNQTHPLSRGLVACYIFNEATGETVFDLSGNGNNGTLENGVAWNGGGLEFDGGNDYVNVSGLTWTPSIFSCAWQIYMKTNVYDQSIGATNGWGSFMFHTGSSGGDVYVGTDLTNRLTPTELPVGTAEVNKWLHFVFVYNGTAGFFYKNGILLASKDMNTSTAWGGFKIGVGATSTINGSIRSVSIYNQAKSAEEIAWLHREPYAMFEPAFNPALLYSAAPPVGAIMNQFQKANIGADLYNGVFA